MSSRRQPAGKIENCRPPTIALSKGLIAAFAISNEDVPCVLLSRTQIDGRNKSHATSTSTTLAPCVHAVHAQPCQTFFNEQTNDENVDTAYYSK